MAANDTDGYLSFAVKVEGEAYADQTSVLSIATYNEVYRIPYAIITISDGDPSLQDFELSKAATLNPGAALTIEMGYKGVNVEVFTGIITKHSVKINAGSSVVIIEAKNKAVKMTVGGNNALYEEKTDGAIITELFTNSGLAALVATTDPFITPVSLMQFESTDWDFAMTRAEANGKIVAFDGTSFQVEDPAIVGEADKTYAFGKDIFEFEATADAETQLKGVTSYSWDMATHALVTSVAAASGFTQLENSGVTKATLEAVTSPTKIEQFHSGQVPTAELAAWGKARLTKANLGKYEAE
jgi:phage protein D